MLDRAEDMPTECINTMSCIAIHAVFEVGSPHLPARSKHAVYNVVPHSDVPECVSGMPRNSLRGCTPIQKPR